MKARIIKHPASKPVNVPELKAGDVLQEGHFFHEAFVKWLEARRERLGEKCAVANKRKARLFLSENNNQRRRLWALMHRQHDAKAA